MNDNNLDQEVNMNDSTQDQCPLFVGKAGDEGLLFGCPDCGNTKLWIGSQWQTEKDEDPDSFSRWGVWIEMWCDNCHRGVHIAVLQCRTIDGDVYTKFDYS